MGRELASLTKDGATYNYKYNYDGLRTYKSDGTNTYNYIWQDGKLISQTGEGNTIKLIYEGDKPTAINYNGTEYYYVTNLQGDVLAILDKNGNCVVEYTYDAWGKVLSVSGSMASTLGSHNPLRYRGYYYDTETGFYYLQSRYYDPTVGRFINADEVGYLGINGTIPSYNLFACCENNPVNNSDPTGQISLTSIKNTLLKPIKALINKVKNMFNKIKIIYKNGVLTLNTGAIAIAIDAISFAISKISHFGVKLGLKILIAWAKSNTSSFISFAKKYIVDNAIKIVISFLKFFCKKIAVSVAWSKFTGKINDTLFGTSKFYKIYNAFSSLGNIVATIFDLMDGKWNEKLMIRIR